MKRCIDIFVFIAEKLIDVLIFFAKIIMGILGVIKARHLGFAVGTALLGLTIFGVINVTLRPFSDEITNTEKFTDYYQDTDEENGGYSLLSSNYFTIHKIYDTAGKKILGNIKNTKPFFQNLKEFLIKLWQGIHFQEFLKSLIRKLL